MENEPKIILENLLTQINSEIREIVNQNSDAQNKSLNFELEFEKTKFQKLIQSKIDNLTIRFNILEFKYYDYKKYYDLTSISIIIISTLLTIIESVKSIFNIEESGNYGLIKTFDLLPILFSSSIALSATMLKFKKYHEKMEKISKCVDLSITTAFKLEKFKDNIETCKDLIKLRENYSKIHNEYIKSEENIEKFLKYKDLVKHMQTYYQLNLRHKKAFANYNYNQLKINIIQNMQQQSIQEDIESGVIETRKLTCMEKISKFFHR